MSSINEIVLGEKRTNLPNDLWLRYDLSGLETVYQILLNCFYHQESTRNKMELIRVFECCYEISWKLLQKELLNLGINVKSEIEVFQKSYIEKLIENSVSWILYKEKKELIYYSYNPGMIDEILLMIPRFIRDVDALINTLALV